MADSSQTNTKKRTEKETANKTKQNNPNFQYSTIGRRILATGNILFILNIHNIKKISLEEIQNKTQKDIKKYFVPSNTNKIRTTNNNECNEPTNSIETTVSTKRHISDSNYNQPVGTKTTKEKKC